LFPITLFAQQTIDPLFLSTSILVGMKDGQEQLKATGFFYEDGPKKLYLVTNKHVIYG
jgi:hypothetical protein